MKTTKEMIEVMAAFEEGAKIEYKKFDKNQWTETLKPTWDWFTVDYRVKPEPKEPTYRPYESIGEMLCDYNKRVCRNNNRPKNTMPLVWVKQVNCSQDRGALIVSFDEDKVWLGGCYIASTLQELCMNYTYLDETPCGKLVEE